MANTKSAQKAARASERRRVINGARSSKIRSAVKKVESAVKSGDAKAAKAALQAANPELQRGVTKGVLKKNTAARKLSRLSAAVKKISAKK
jgi:small subunit ribosomal protein S20